MRSDEAPDKAVLRYGSVDLKGVILKMHLVQEHHPAKSALIFVVVSKVRQVHPAEVLR